MQNNAKPQRNGFTLMDLLVTMAGGLILVMAFFVIYPPLSLNARKTRNLTQLRGIHQGFVTWGQGGKRSIYRNPFPGLSSRGMIIVPNGPATGHSGDGTQPGARFQMLLAGNYFTPDYMLNPADSASTELFIPPHPATFPPVTSAHYSYALLALPATTPNGRTEEWHETLNPNAIVLSDRAIGSGRADISSVWTRPGSGT
ncbi:MAG: hypothetical protein V3V20_03340 [Algisphaera sp.]